MKLLVLIVAIAIVLAIVSLRRRDKSRTNSKSNNLPDQKAGKARVQARSPYRATSIVYDEKACSAARELGGKRFLDVERDIPKLPLSGCDAAHCSCKYESHDDRRSDDEDRRIPNALQADLYTHTGSEERRKSKRGRRKSDMH